MREDLEDLLNLAIAAEDRRDPILPREPIEIGRELLQVRRQIEPLLQTLVPQFEITQARLHRCHQCIRIRAMPPQDRDRTPCVSSKSARNKSAGSTLVCPAPLAC